MYNEELKKRFLEKYSKEYSWCCQIADSVFEASGKEEELLGKDICTMSTSEIKPLLVKLSSLRSRSLSRILLLRDYIKWCLEEGVENANPELLDVEADGIEKVRTQTVSNPKHLQWYLDMLFNPEESGEVDNTYRCFYWLAYAGMEEEDTLEVTTDDIDLTNMRIIYKKRDTVLPLYVEALPAFRNCVEMTSFRYINSTYKKDIFRDRLPGNLLLRGVRAYPNLKSMRVKLSQVSKKNEEKTGLRLSYFRVWLSGLFYRTRENEQIGITPTFDDIADQKMEGKSYKLDSGRNTVGAKHRQIARDFENDYERWKAAWK